MKRLKKFVTLFTLAAVCFAIPGLGKITVKAAEPTTYVLNYSDSSSEWRYKEASSWSAEVQDRELYYLQQNIKDGDYIVIDNDVENNALALKVSVRLGNLTFKNTVGVPVVYANGYDSVYFLSGTSGAVNGDVSHAYVYGDAKANFNSNVDTLEMIGLTDDKSNNLHATINGVGTVNHLIAKDGSLKTEAKYYSTTAPAPVAAAEAAPAATEQPTQTTAPAQATQNSTSSEYDNVPKTGENSAMFWLLGAAVVCMAGGYTIRRKNVQEAK